MCSVKEEIRGGWGNGGGGGGGEWGGGRGVDLVRQRLISFLPLLLIGGEIMETI